MAQKLKKTLEKLPGKAGIYQFLNDKGAILYIGKANNIKARVSSYFRKNPDLNESKLKMTGKTERIEYIITDTEKEALLLEATLIKKHKPKYNISLRDDKFYQYIKITRGGWPLVLTVRNTNDKKAMHFGPYTSGASLAQTLKTIKKIYPYLTKEKPAKRQCLQYHLKRCTEPCLHTAPRSEKNSALKKEYKEIIKKIIKLLRGQYEELIYGLTSKMKQASAEQKFEQAAKYRDQMRALKKITGGQKVIFKNRENQDVLSLYQAGSLSAVNLFKIRGGKLIFKETFEINHPKASSAKEIISAFIFQYYPDVFDPPQELILPADLSQEEKNIKRIIKGLKKITAPKAGVKKKLIEMGAENAKDFLDKKETGAAPARKALQELAKTLNLKHAPKRIEAYDISNIQGANMVGAMAVFTNGLKDKSQYRKFQIKYTKGQNDAACLSEIALRRFKNTWTRPDLIVIDGGKGQLNTVYSALCKLSQSLSKIPMISLAKREEDIFTVWRKTPIKLPKTSKALQLLQRARDEAHRFAIEYHRYKRSKLLIN